MRKSHYALGALLLALSLAANAQTPQIPPPTRKTGWCFSTAKT
jgi:hypothetical protein